jgi:serine protease inhibitor
LPNENQNVDYVMNLMSTRDFENVVTSIDSESSKADVNITMPKFKIESTTNLIEPLQKI